MDIPTYLMAKNAGGGKGALKYVVVEELPTVGENNIIYLVPKSTSSTNNYYDEYMYINSAWELIGDTEVDLSTKQDVMQFVTLPTANASNLGKVYQYTGATNANYTNGYFYLCVSDGETVPTYSWEQINVQDGVSYTAGDNISIDNGVINNTIPYGKDRNDSNANMRIGSTNVIPYSAYHSLIVGSGQTTHPNTVTVGMSARTTKQDTIALGYGAKTNHAGSIAIGSGAITEKNNQIMIGASGAPINEATIYTSNGAKKLATEEYADSKASQVSTMPTASADNLDKIVQFTGTTTNDYTNGYFYKCVSDGQDPATYSWENIDVMDAGGSYTAGDNIEITQAGVINNTIPYEGINTSLKIGKNSVIQSNKSGQIAIGYDAKTYNSDTFAIGNNSTAGYTGGTSIGHSTTAASNSIAIGYGASSGANSVQFGSNASKINTMYIYTSSGNKKMATEDYVDNAISTAITSALGGSY